MNIKDDYLNCDGRIGRKKFILLYLPLAAISIAMSMIDQMTGKFLFLNYGFFSILSLVVFAWPAICLLVKRFKDRNRPVWFVILAFIPIINFWTCVELFLLRGTIGSNQYGDDPLEILDGAGAAL